jgi:hypothetical protein
MQFMHDHATQLVFTKTFVNAKQLAEMNTIIVNNVE